MKEFICKLKLQKQIIIQNQMDLQQGQIDNRPIKVFSYNTLIEKPCYTETVKNDPGWRNYNWQSRRQQIILKIVSQEADVIYLQEIKHASRYRNPNFYTFYNPLNQMGFEGVFAKRNIGGDQGEEALAIFFNKNHLDLVQTDVIYFEDGTGRLALCATLRSHYGNVFRVVTTHFIFPNSLQQVEKEVKTLAEWNIINQKDIPCILAGDFNLCSDVPSHFEIMKNFEERFIDSHKLMDCAKPTFSLNLQGSNCPGMIKQVMGTKLDYILVSKDIKTVSAAVAGNIANLPTINEPSDHLPVTGIYLVPIKHKTVQQDIKKLIETFIQVTQRNYYTNPKFQQFMDLFWLLPRTIKNTVYQLTYEKAVKLDLYEDNPQFGRVAFSNNTYRMETILDEEGNCKPLKLQVVKHDLIPHEVILQILKIVQQRIQSIPSLIKELESIEFSQFLEKFDDQLHAGTCNLIYGQTYKLARDKGIPTGHFDYGRVSFRKMQGWDIDNSIRVKAMKKLQLP